MLIFKDFFNSILFGAKISFPHKPFKLQFNIHVLLLQILFMIAYFRCHSLFSRMPQPSPFLAGLCAHSPGGFRPFLLQRELQRKGVKDLEVQLGTKLD